jgi:hypothetical protein
MMRVIRLMCIAIVAGAGGACECEAQQSGEPLSGAALAEIVPKLREKVYADLAGDKPPLPKHAKIAELAKSPGYQFGCEQLRRMVRDRSAIARDLAETDELWIATAYLLGGAGTEVRLVWNPELIDAPSNSPTAFAVFDSKTNTGIKLAVNQGGFELEPDQMWQALIFELHNGLTNIEHVPAIREKASRGLITSRQYVEEMTRAAYKAARQSRLFYVDVYLPWIAAHGRSSSPNSWYCADFAGPEEAAAKIAGEGTFYDRYFTADYHFVRACDLYGKGRYAEAAPYYERLARDGTSDEVRLTGLKYLGDCRSEQRKFPEAISAFRQALELETTSSGRADLYCRLGYAYDQNREPRRALAELDRAKQESDAGQVRRLSMQMQISLAERIADQKLLRELCEEHVRAFPDDDTLPQVRRFKKVRR